MISTVRRRAGPCGHDDRPWRRLRRSSSSCRRSCPCRPAGRVPFSVRSGEDVVLVDDEQPAGNAPAVFGQPGFGVDLVVGGMQIVDAAGDLHARGIDPRALADPVARVDRRGAAHGLNAEIGAPGLGAGAGLGRQRLAMRCRRPAMPP